MGIAAVKAEFRKSWEDAFARTVQDIVDDLEAIAPRDTGYLAAGITAGRLQISGVRYSATIQSEAISEDGADYAAIQDFGSGPYRITPNTKKALFWDGARHPVASVNHPGVSKWVGWFSSYPFETTFVDLFERSTR